MEAIKFMKKNDSEGVTLSRSRASMAGIRHDAVEPREVFNVNQKL